MSLHQLSLTWLSSDSQGLQYSRIMCTCIVDILGLFTEYELPSSPSGSRTDIFHFDLTARVQQLVTVTNDLFRATMLGEVLQVHYMKFGSLIDVN